MTTGEKIQKLRKDRRITQEEFADRLGVSRQSVSKWETDQAYPETETVVALCCKRAKPVVLILAVGFAGTAIRSCGMGAFNYAVTLTCFVLAVAFGIAMLIFACVKPKREEPLLALNAGI